MSNIRLLNNFKTKLVFKIFFHFVAIVLIFIMMLSISIGCMYKSFVVLAKKQQITNIYDQLKDLTPTEISNRIDDINFSHNIRIYVLDNNLKPVRNIQFFPEKFFIKETINIISKYEDELKKNSYVFADSLNEHRPPDTMQFVGKLNSGGYMFATLSYMFVRENIGYSISFILLFSIIAVVLCAVVSYVLAKKICKPIINITEITKKIAWLDFSEKCDITENDELGVLARNVNFLSEQLEQNINELKAEIIKERKIDEMRKNLIINVSHELKTPIFLIQSYAEGLRENISCNEDDRNYYCHVIEDEAKRMDSMVKELLNLAKLESGKENLKMEKFSLSTFVNQVISVHTITIKNKNINISVNVNNSQVSGDIKLLKNAFNNLIINAIDHTNDYGEIIIVSTENDNSVILTVYNSGSEIDDNEINKIWHSFYKVDKSRKRGYGGSGIGLSIVKAVMESHGTNYGVKNVNDGVEFYIEINKAF